MGQTSSFLRRVTVIQQRITQHLPFGSPWTRGPLHVLRSTDRFLSTAVTQRSVGGKSEGREGFLPDLRGCVFTFPSRQEQRYLPIQEELLFSMGTAGTTRRAICPWSPVRPPPTTKQLSVSCNNDGSVL